jgi:hypothetical protein
VEIFIALGSAAKCPDFSSAALRLFCSVVQFTETVYHKFSSQLAIGWLHLMSCVCLTRWGDIEQKVASKVRRAKAELATQKRCIRAQIEHSSGKTVHEYQRAN